MIVKVEGDGKCPWCGRRVVTDDIEIHHRHVILTDTTKQSWLTEGE